MLRNSRYLYPLQKFKTLTEFSKNIRDLVFILIKLKKRSIMIIKIQTRAIKVSIITRIKVIAIRDLDLEIKNTGIRMSKGTTRSLMDNSHISNLITIQSTNSKLTLISLKKSLRHLKIIIPS